MIQHLNLNRKVWEFLPYLYFIGLATFWFLGDLFIIQNFSFLAFSLSIGLILQAIWQHKLTGACLGVLAVIGSLYAFLAVISEFNDSEAVNDSAMWLLAVGSALSLTGLVMGLSLAVSNIRKLALS